MATTEAPAASPPVEAKADGPTPSVVEASAVEGPAATGSPAAPSKGEAPPAAEEASPTQKSLLGQAQKEDPAPEVKPEDQKKVEAKSDTAPVDPASLPPITYTDFTFPKDFTPEPSAIKGLTDVLARHRAPQELGQSLIDLYSAEISRAGASQVAEWERVQRDWQRQVREDPSIGGDNHKATMSSAARLIDTYGTKELREALDLTGAGNHPAMVKFFHNLASALKESGPVPARDGPAPIPKSRAQRRYGNTLSKGT